MQTQNSMWLRSLASYGSLVSALFAAPAASSAWPSTPDQFEVGITSQNCPFAGRLFPPARNPGSSTALNAAQESLKSQLDATFKSGALLPLNITLDGSFFSIGVFSIADASNGTLFDYHHAPNATSESELDNESVYRVGSISKLLTAYTLLVERGDIDWNQPITNFIPGLYDSVSEDNEELGRFRWEDITIGALASHLSGVPRDYALPDYMNALNTTALKAVLGINTSALQPDEAPTCGLPSTTAQQLPLCSQEDFIKGINNLGPYFPAFESPTYSNVGYRLLGYAIENITGEPFNQTFKRTLQDPLCLSHTSLTAPFNNTKSVIPSGGPATGWDANIGDDGPAGGFYSTINDLTALGRSILQSTLLSQAQTRRWLKAHSRTADDNHSVGAPWEISSFRIPLTTNATATTRIDIYAKSGNLGYYNSFIGLDPDRAWGFVVLGAGRTSGLPVYHLGNLIARTYAPAFEAAARAEAAAAYAGTFVVEEDDSNSTLTLMLQADRPGIGVTEWSANGVDVLKALAVSTTATTTATGGSVRLYPARMRTETKVAFRALYEPLPAGNMGGPLDSACQTWFQADLAQVGGRMVDDVVVGVDEETGRAEWVEARAWRMRYVRVGVE